jgi:hypothetical protein
MKPSLLKYSCLFLLALGACKDITHVQTGYISDRDECRSHSESTAGVYSQPESYPLNDKERNTALLQLFCECMKEKDWKVAGCPKPPVVVAATPAPQAPTVVVVQQSPTSQPAYVAQQPAPAPATQPATPIYGAKKKKKACTIPTVCPAPIDNSSSKLTPLQTDQQINGIIQRQ